MVRSRVAGQADWGFEIAVLLPLLCAALSGWARAIHWNGTDQSWLIPEALHKAVEEQGFEIPRLLDLLHGT